MPGVSSQMDVANTAIGAAADKLYNIHTAEAYVAIRQLFFDAGLPTDTYDRLLAIKTEYHKVLALRDARNDAYRGEAVDPRLDAGDANKWIKILHSSARATAIDLGPVGEALLNRLGVGSSPSDNPREAYASVEKLLTALSLLPAGTLTLPATFIEDGKALVARIPKGEGERESELAARMMATRRTVELESELEKIFNQVLTRAELVEAITGQPVPGVDFGYLRAASNNGNNGGGGGGTPSASHNGEGPGL